MPTVRQQKVFTFKGSIIAAEQAQVIGEHLEKLAKGRLSELSPEELVKDGRKASSPLHSLPGFSWDSKDEAAEKWRLHYARTILNHLQYRIVSLGDSKPRKMYVNVIIESPNSGARQVYVSQEKAVKVPELREQLIEQARRYYLTGKQRFREINELAGIHQAIDEVFPPEAA